MQKKESVIEIGLILYPESQLAAVHGLTDLFRVANRIVDLKKQNLAVSCGSPIGKRSLLESLSVHLIRIQISKKLGPLF
jgi:transcriptional regulator GlxA family with amidase domain